MKKNKNLKKELLRKSISAVTALMVVMASYSAYIPADAATLTVPLSDTVYEYNIGEYSTASTDSQIKNISLKKEYKGNFTIAFDMLVNSELADNSLTITATNPARVSGFLKLGAYDSETNSYPLIWRLKSDTNLGINISADKKYTYELSFINVGNGIGASATVTVKDDTGECILEKSGLGCRNFSDTLTNAVRNGEGFSQITLEMASKSENTAAVASFSNEKITYKGTDNINVTASEAEVIENSEIVKKQNVLLDDENTVLYAASSGAEYVLSNNIPILYDVEYKLNEEITGVLIEDNKLIILANFPEGESSFTFKALVDNEDRSEADINVTVKKDVSSAQEIIDGYKKSLVISDKNGSKTNKSNILKTSSQLIIPQSDEFVNISWNEFQMENGSWVNSDIINTQTGEYTAPENYSRRIKLVANIESKTDKTVTAEKVFYIDISNPESYCNSGKCGDDMEWTYADGVLTITGSGDMWDYNETNNIPPWRIFNPESVVIEEGVKSIGAYSFRGIDLGDNISLPSTLERIGEYAFYSSNVIGMKFPEGLKSIARYAFYYAYLEEVIIPDSVTELGESAFRNAYITNVKLPEGITEIPDYCFRTLDLREVYMPDSVKKIGDFAFAYSKLTDVRLPDTVVEIGENAFNTYGDYDDSGAKYIGKHLVEVNDMSMSEFTVKEGTLDIAGGLFYNNDNLTSIDIPESVQIISSNAFAGCDNLVNINVSENTFIRPSAFVNTGYYKEISNWTDGELYLGSTLLAVDNSKIEDGVYTVKEGTRVIGDYAFDKCYDLKEVKFPAGLEIIGDCAFNYCNPIESLKIPDGVTDMGMIYHCDKLKDVYIPKSVKLNKSILSECFNINNVYYAGSKSDWDRQKMYYQNENNDVNLYFNADDMDNTDDYEPVKLKVVNMLPEYKDKLSIDAVVSGSGVKLMLEKSADIDLSEVRAYVIYFNGDGAFCDAGILKKDDDGFVGKLKGNNYKVVIWNGMTPIAEAVK